MRRDDLDPVHRGRGVRVDRPVAGGVARRREDAGSAMHDGCERGGRVAPHVQAHSLARLQLVAFVHRVARIRGEKLERGRRRDPVDGGIEMTGPHRAQHEPGVGRRGA